MPWTAKDAPKNLKGNDRTKWAEIANSVYRECMKTGNDKTCAPRAKIAANSKFSEDVMEENEFNWKDHDLHFDIMDDDVESRLAAQADAKKKPGGSNVGKYKKGPFCGPSGGAPAGSYPVNTRARAIAAISYARHAPRPAGIKACVCRHYSDLPACSKKKEKQSMAEEIKKMPKAALCFIDHEGFALAKDKDGKDSLQMVAYSGGIIKAHWYWGDLAIDLSGMKFPKKKNPILENHMTDRKVAFTNDKPKIDSGALVIDEAEFVDTEASLEFRVLSKQGFPYESSIYAKPTIIEKLEVGAKAEVNGMSVKGPATIWRESIFKEASVCVFGADSNTKAVAFADEEVEFTVNILTNAEPDEPSDQIQGEGVTAMNVDELKKDHPELFDEIVADVTTTLTDGFNKEKAEMQRQFDTERADTQAKVLALEKAEAIRKEKELKFEAGSIWAARLLASDIPDRLFDKVRAQVSYDKFVKDGNLDVVAFSAAVDEEIKDWQGKGIVSSVLGEGFSVKEAGDSETARINAQEKADVELADTLFSFVRKEVT